MALVSSVMMDIILNLENVHAMLFLTVSDVQITKHVLNVHQVRIFFLFNLYFLIFIVKLNNKF